MKVFKKAELSQLIINKCKLVKKRLLICSPYIGGLKYVSGILGNKYRSSGKITLKLLVDSSNSLNCDFTTLNHLINFNFDVKSLKGLHAKIYIIDDEVIVSSANLSRMAFEQRSEIGVLLNSGDSKEAIDVFNTYFREAVNVSKFTEQQIKKQKRKSKKPGEEKSGGVGKKFYSIPIEQSGDYAAWLKISGLNNFESRTRDFKANIEVKNSFHGCPKKPRLKKDDIVILSRMGRNNDENDHFIFGRAIVDVPFREGIDDLNKYINIKNLNKATKKSIKRWPYGFWVKKVEVIKSNSDFVWLKQLNDSNGNELILPKSLGQQSHIKLDKDQLLVINAALDKKFQSVGKLRCDNPTGIWINKHLPKNRRIKKNDIN